MLAENSAAKFVFISVVWFELVLCDKADLGAEADQLFQHDSKNFTNLINSDVLVLRIYLGIIPWGKSCSRSECNSKFFCPNNKVDFDEGSASIVYNRLEYSGKKESTFQLQQLFPRH